jgi:hypothetical protein
VRVRAIPPPNPAERYLFQLLAQDTAGPPSPGADAAFWCRTLDLVTAHRLAEHLYVRRERGGWWPSWPREARAELRGQYVQTALRNTRYREELLRLLPALAAEGIVPVLLKGAALTLTVSEDPAERPYGDVDFLVRRLELDRAAATLRKLGYVLDERYQSEEFYRSHHYHLIFRRPDKPWLCFEVHWDLTLPLMDTRIDAEGVRSRSVPCWIDGSNARVPAPTDLLLHLALHAAVSGFGRLGQILDVAKVLARHGEIMDPEEVWERARDWRVSLPLRGSLALTSLFGPCPAAGRLLAAGPRAQDTKLAAALLRPVSLLRRRTVRSVAGGMALALWRRDRYRDRLRCLARQFLPSAAEMAMNGHPIPPVTVRGRLPLVGMGASVVLRTAVWTLLALAGLEVEPREEPDPAAQWRGAGLGRAGPEWVPPPEDRDSQHVA